MLLAKAQAVAGAVTNAGYRATIDPTYDFSGAVIANGWKVQAHSDRSDVLIDTIKTLQDAQGVVGTVRDVVFT